MWKKSRPQQITPCLGTFYLNFNPLSTSSSYLRPLACMQLKAQHILHRMLCSLCSSCRHVTFVHSLPCV
ncbi:hypothetical protein XELAEV_18027478mg [Xenopus laevis]|uniref:Uncharacterized protein n=1 Tax=Xenopus laevis TaxID=8355 RepID=A0A974CVK3_XENLA|nr:hypothetical protein XELAEV_18027478mg [Xenopus laevis]